MTNLLSRVKLKFVRLEDIPSIETVSELYQLIIVNYALVPDQSDFRVKMKVITLQLASFMAEPEKSLADLFASTLPNEIPFLTQFCETTMGQALFYLYPELLKHVQADLWYNHHEELNYLSPIQTLLFQGVEDDYILPIIKAAPAKILNTIYSDTEIQGFSLFLSLTLCIAKNHKMIPVVAHMVDKVTADTLNQVMTGFRPYATADSEQYIYEMTPLWKLCESAHLPGVQDIIDALYIQNKIDITTLALPLAQDCSAFRQLTEHRNVFPTLFKIVDTIDPNLIATEELFQIALNLNCSLLGIKIYDILKNKIFTKPVVKQLLHLNRSERNKIRTLHDFIDVLLMPHSLHNESLHNGIKIFISVCRMYLTRGVQLTDVLKFNLCGISTLHWLLEIPSVATAILHHPEIIKMVSPDMWYENTITDFVEKASPFSLLLSRIDGALPKETQETLLPLVCALSEIQVNAEISKLTDCVKLSLLHLLCMNSSTLLMIANIPDFDRKVSEKGLNRLSSDTALNNLATPLRCIAGMMHDEKVIAFATKLTGKMTIDALHYTANNSQFCILILFSKSVKAHPILVALQEKIDLNLIPQQRTVFLANLKSSHMGSRLAQTLKEKAKAAKSASTSLKTSSDSQQVVKNIIIPLAEEARSKKNQSILTLEQGLTKLLSDNLFNACSITFNISKNRNTIIFIGSDTESNGGMRLLAALIKPIADANKITITGVDTLPGAKCIFRISAAENTLLHNLILNGRLYTLIAAHKEKDNHSDNGGSVKHTSSEAESSQAIRPISAQTIDKENWLRELPYAFCSSPDVDIKAVETAENILNIIITLPCDGSTWLARDYKGRATVEALEETRPLSYEYLRKNVLYRFKNKLQLYARVYECIENDRLVLIITPCVERLPSLLLQEAVFAKLKSDLPICKTIQLPQTVREDAPLLPALPIQEKTPVITKSLFDLTKELFSLIINKPEQSFAFITLDGSSAKRCSFTYNLAAVQALNIAGKCIASRTFFELLKSCLFQTTHKDILRLFCKNNVVTMTFDFSHFETQSNNNSLQLNANSSAEWFDSIFTPSYIKTLSTCFNELLAQAPDATTLLDKPAISFFSLPATISYPNETAAPTLKVQKFATSLARTMQILYRDYNYTRDKKNLLIHFERFEKIQKLQNISAQIKFFICLTSLLRILECISIREDEFNQHVDATLITDWRNIVRHGFDKLSLTNLQTTIQPLITALRKYHDRLQSDHSKERTHLFSPSISQHQSVASIDPDLLTELETKCEPFTLALQNHALGNDMDAKEKVRLINLYKISLVKIKKLHVNELAETLKRDAILMAYSLLYTLGITVHEGVDCGEIYRQLGHAGFDQCYEAFKNNLYEEQVLTPASLRLSMTT